MIRVAAAAAALALLSGANGCCACASSGRFERHGAAAESPPAPAPLAPPLARVLHFGDFGDDTCQQAAVAAGIADAQRRRRFDLAFHAGDNLYDCGPDWRTSDASRCAFAADGATPTPGLDAPRDPSFREKFEEPLGALVDAGVPIYVALGNHDVNSGTRCVPIGDAVAVSRTKACLEVAHRSAAWSMPARHYVIDFPGGAAPPAARFIVLDSNVVVGDYGGFTLADEIAFLSSSAAGCDAFPCFVIAHHPAASAGAHATDFTPGHTDRMARLVAAGGGNLRGWLSGHDHDLQHLRTAGGLDVLISGNGSRDRTDERFSGASPAGATLLFGTVSWGHALLEISADGFTWRAEDERGVARYCCQATRAAAWSRCEPVRCD
jgi:hypothetical protein